MHRKAVFVLWAAILLGSTCRLAAESATPAFPELQTSSPRVLLNIDPTTQYTRNSEGDMIVLKDGSLALVYTRFVKGDDDHSPADLVLRTSRDGGRTWTGDRVVVANEGGCNVMSVSLLRLPSNEILLFYLRKDSAAGLCTIYVRRSQDELQTLSEPVRVSSVDGYHVMNNARVIRTSSGRLIAPAILHAGFADETTSATRFSPPGLPFAYYSDDDGRSWKRDNTPLLRPAAGPVLQENGVVELRDGRILMFMRTDQGNQFEAFSTDGGVNWSKPGPGPLASPLSPASIARIPWNGHLLAIWNDHSGRHPFPKGKRTPLCAAVSLDDGKSWSPSHLIESDPQGWYCYTSILFHEGSALISYCAGDKKAGLLNRLRVTELPREWLESLGQ